MATTRPSAGSVGPRLAGRLTAELISRSPQYMSCVKMYEIDLRGNKITVIENLGVTENQFDSIDLSDNAIVKLEGFPKLHRLKQLLLNNNHVARIARKLEEAIPNLEVLVLTNNRLSNLQDLDPLASLTKIKFLSLVGNPVVHKPNYRLYVISKLKGLKILDFRKVKKKEREDAMRLFPTEEAAAQHGAKTFEPNEEFEAAQAKGRQESAMEAEGAGVEAAAAASENAASKGPTPEQLLAIKAAVANAQTLEEIKRLEEALKSGQTPSTYQVDGQGQQAAGAAGDKPDNMEVG